MISTQSIQYTPHFSPHNNPHYHHHPEQPSSFSEHGHTPRYSERRGADHLPTVYQSSPLLKYENTLMSHNAQPDWQEPTSWGSYYALPAAHGYDHQQPVFNQQQQPQQPQHGDWTYDTSLHHQSQPHHNLVTNKQLAAQQQSRSFPSQQLHRRALSNSSSGTFGSNSNYNISPAPPQQQTTYLEAPQSYPTPVHSPVRDTYAMANKRASHSSATRLESGAARGVNYNNSHPRPGSDHSSTGHDFPVTPQTINGDEQTMLQETKLLPGHPKLDRTMTDIYADELYDPNQQFTAVAEQPPLPADYHTNFLSPNRQVLQAVQAANQARSVSPRTDDYTQGGISPFRKGSEFFPAEAMASAGNPMQTAAGLRQQQKAEADRLAMEQHSTLHREATEPKTISPKDAVLDYTASEDHNHSLFPDSQGLPNEQMYAPHNANVSSQRSQSSGNFNFNGNDMRYAQYQGGPPSNASQETAPDFPAHLVSMETTRSEHSGSSDTASSGSASDVPLQRPANTLAGTGTYTCTYHGCTLRFESPAKLQKHKREDHRSTGHSHGINQTSANTDNPATTMTQAGPHRCERINPQTGKPCNTVFSRPYDLTRHEDTIHNRQKTKVRCPFCSEEKTFSRNDALTRHLKVVHPDVDVPGKHARKSSVA